MGSRALDGVAKQKSFSYDLTTIAAAAGMTPTMETPAASARQTAAAVAAAAPTLCEHTKQSLQNGSREL